MLFTSPGRQSKLSDARNSIDECIFNVSDKKKMNDEAFNEVRQLNNEVLGALTTYNPSKHNIYENRNKTEENIKKDSFREQVVTSQFQWGPTSPKVNYQESYQNTFNAGENNDLGTRLNS